MNKYEKRMLAIIQQGKAEFGFDAIKAEFEAEGTRVDELLRLLEIARRADVKVGLKIGGCEAMRDMIECRQYGIDYMIAPMVETPYALKKYIEAKDKIFPAEEREDIGFLFNVETISTFGHVEAMADVAQASGGVGMVFGRVDFAGSMGRNRDFVNGEEMITHIEAVARQCSQKDLPLVVGGGVSQASIEPLRRVRKIRLDRFETRKIIFDAAILDGEKAAGGLELAVEFELLWLKNKRDYYASIAKEDEQRIAMMEERQRSQLTIPA